MSERRNADKSRLLVRSRGVGMLSTVMADGGAPYGSLVTYACDHQGQPVFLFSGLSDHTKNIAADARAALLVENAVRNRNPQTGPRVTVMGTIHRDKKPETRARFLARHPDAALYADFGDFGFYRMTVERVHYVGGFARAVWFEAKHVLTAKKTAAALAEIEESVVLHMNADHADAVRAYAESILRRRPGNWRMTGCDSDGADLMADGRHARLEYDKPVTDSTSCRSALVEMAGRARN
jgi:putative heme iron utilization protein